MSQDVLDEFVDASEMAQAVANRSVSPVDLVEATFDRIDRYNDALNVVVFADPEGARERARQAEQAVIAKDPLGPLHGVPTLMKDLFDFYPGWPTTFGGIPVFKDNRTEMMCGFADRMTRAGANIVGKTNSPIHGFRGTCDNPLFGPTRNPFNLDLNAGGSSGSVAAVAAGIVPFAEGSDAGGSIRIPAAWSGTVGLKATFGLFPMMVRPNGFTAMMPFIAEGTLTRTVADAALTASVMAEYNPRDPLSMPAMIDWSLDALPNPKDIRIGYCPDFAGIPVEPQILVSIEAALNKAADAGMTIETVSVPMPAHHLELSDAWCRLLANHDFFDGVKAAGIDLLKDYRDDFPPEYLRWLDADETRTTRDVARDQMLRTGVLDAIEDAIDPYDAIITPTTGCMPVPNTDDGNTLGPSSINGEPVDNLLGWAHTYPLNMSGHPGVSIPSGLSNDGIPIGMQIIGRRFADGDILRIAARFEQINPWANFYTSLDPRLTA